MARLRSRRLDAMPILLLALWAPLVCSHPDLDANPGPETKGGGTVWRREVIQAAGNTGSDISVAVDRIGNPKMLFFDPTLSLGTFATWDGIGWVRRSLGPALGRGDLAVDDGNVVHLAWDRPASPLVGQVVYDNGSVAGPPQVVGVGTGPSIAVDANRNPAITFYGPDESLRFAWLTEAGWIEETISTDPLFAVDRSGHGAPVVFDSEGRPLVLHRRAMGPLRLYRREHDGSWSLRTLADEGYWVGDIAVDPLGVIHVVWGGEGYDGEPALLLARSQDGDNWAVEAIPNSTAAVCRLRIDAFNRPVVVALEVGLPARHFDVAIFTREASGDWTERPAGPVEIWDDSFTKPHFSLSLDPLTGAVNLALQAAWHDAVRLSEGSAMATTVVAADFVSDVNLGHDQDDRVYLAYYSYGSTPGQNGLVLQIRENGSWTFVQLPADFVDGVELQVLGRRRAMVSYYDSSAGELRLATWSDGALSVETLPTAPGTGRDHTLAVEHPTNQPWLALWNQAAHRLEVWTKGAQGWVEHRPPTPALISDPQPTIVRAHRHQRQRDTTQVLYIVAETQELRLATLTLQGWTDRRIGDVGVGSRRLFDLDLDAEGTPWAMWIDAGSGDLVSASLGGVVAPTPLTASTQLGIPSIVDSARFGFACLNGPSCAFAFTADVASRSLLLSRRLPAGPPEHRIIDSDASGHAPSIDSGFGHRWRVAYRGGANGGLHLAWPTSTEPYLAYNPLQPCALPEGSSNPVRAAARTKGTSDPTAWDDLEVLRRFRDLLATSQEGQDWIELFYQFAPETGGLALLDPELLLEGWGTMNNLIPVLRALVSGSGGDVVVSAELIDSLNRLFDRLEAAGSPELGAAIASRRAATNNLEDFVGSRADDVARALGVEPAVVFSDGFESGTTEAWSATSPAGYSENGYRVPGTGY